jgi:hypothetical protein
VNIFCNKVLKRAAPVPWQPSYGRAAISGAIAGVWSGKFAEDQKFHPRFEQQNLLSVRTLLSVIGGGIAGVSREAERVRRFRETVLQLDGAFSRVSNMSDAEIADVVTKAQF